MSHLYAVLFVGGINPFLNYPRYENDLKRSANAIATVAGYEASRMRILWGPGGESIPVGSDTFKTAPGTRDQLALTIREFAARIKPEDRFIFFASNHGGRSPDAAKSTLWCWQRTEIIDEELAKWCDAIQSDFRVFILGQCYSGGFIRPLSRPTRIVMTACAWNEPSYATADLNYDEFILRTMEALEAHATTWRAVFTYARAADTRGETPQYSDVGGLGDNPDFLIYR